MRGGVGETFPAAKSSRKNFTEPSQGPERRKTIDETYFHGIRRTDEVSRDELVSKASQAQLRPYATSYVTHVVDARVFAKECSTGVSFGLSFIRANTPFLSPSFSLVSLFSYRRIFCADYGASASKSRSQISVRRQRRLTGTRKEDCLSRRGLPIRFIFFNFIHPGF